MLIRDHYRDPAALGNEQVLTPVGSGVERKEGLGEEEEGIKRVTGRQVGSHGFVLQLQFWCRQGSALGSRTKVLSGRELSFQGCSDRNGLFCWLTNE